jgi:hypothetical protein
VYEIIVVDNASTDNSVSKIQSQFKAITIISNDQNYGFGSANNIGAKKAKGKYLLLLNSDCILVENTVHNFVYFFENYKKRLSLGAIGSFLYNNEFSRAFTYGKFPTIYNELCSIFGKYLYFGSIKEQVDSHKRNKTFTAANNYFKVDYIVGACLFLEREVFNSINGFSEDYFLYAEEIDLQKRMNNINLNQYILSSERVIHLEGASSKNNADHLKQILILVSLNNYYFHNHSKLQHLIYYLLNLRKYLVPLFSNKYSIMEKMIYRKLLAGKRVDMTPYINSNQNI